MSVTREIRGEILLLHPERALLWPARRTVIVADTHFGKSSVFAHHGLAVPNGADALDRQRLTNLIAQSGSTRLLVLGDFLHGALAAWFEARALNAHVSVTDETDYAATFVAVEQKESR